MVDVITKYLLFGDTHCCMYSIEWQKRGLPHAHMLVWLQQKIQATDIDKVITAELPDPHTDPLLFDIVKRHTIHGPCCNLNNKYPCMSDGKCTKQYLRDLIRETQTGEDGYPLYRRRRPGDGGFTTYMNMHNREIEVDNRWIVSYNPVLSKMFQAHTNVKWCHSVKSIKYICKYINKGSDQAVFQLQNTAPILDEVQSFLLGRYISSNEAVWKNSRVPHPRKIPHCCAPQRLFGEWPKDIFYSR
jgi:hypothetical protein